MDAEMDSVITNTGVNEKYTMKQETNQPERCISYLMVAKWLFKTECKTVKFISLVFHVAVCFVFEICFYSKEPTKIGVQRKVLHPQADESQ
ncbi:hypothetical protein T12_13274 [Trichinella patagoniensis]|uniref:Uncharacterized protein n=1 Tax=Trichinella patagoniensis TaxID=990121 RepID=A0A0V0ZGC9_9BILA|nr:hypothetical protein T12_13274 [Trichinella patagoniensis]